MIDLNFMLQRYRIYAVDLNLSKKNLKIFGNPIKPFYLCIRFIIVMNTTLKKGVNNETVRKIIRT